MYKHGMSDTRLYYIWRGMKKRCYNHKNKDYKWYGARGIAICDEWLNDSTMFFEWSFANGYNDSLTLDRIDNNKGYSPDNCRWIIIAEQQKNKRNSFILEYNGEWLSLNEIAKIEGVSRQLAHSRYIRTKKNRLPIKYLYNTKGDE